jgi:hypothetical protein
MNADLMNGTIVMSQNEARKAGRFGTDEYEMAGNIDPNRAKPLQIGALLVVDMFTTMGNSSIFFVFFRIETF